MLNPVEDIDLAFLSDCTSLAMSIVNKTIIGEQYLISVTCSPNRIYLSLFVCLFLLVLRAEWLIHRSLTDVLMHESHFLSC